MSILNHRMHGLEAVITDLQRLAVRTAAPTCTREQVKAVLQSFSYQSSTRAEMVLCLYWQLAEGHVSEWPCQAFLEQLRQRERTDAEGTR